MIIDFSNAYQWLQGDEAVRQQIGTANAATLLGIFSLGTRAVREDALRQLANAGYLIQSGAGYTPVLVSPAPIVGVEPGVDPAMPQLGVGVMPWQLPTESKVSTAWSGVKVGSGVAVAVGVAILLGVLFAGRSR